MRIVGGGGPVLRNHNPSCPPANCRGTTRSIPSKVRVKGAAREYRISAEAIREYYELTDAEMKGLANEMVRYRVGFMGWGLGLPFPHYKDEHPTYDSAVAEAKRVLAILPRFREENAEMEQWLPVNFPEKPDKAIVYPNPFDRVKPGKVFEHPGVRIIDSTEPGHDPSC